MTSLMVTCMNILIDLIVSLIMTRNVSRGQGCYQCCKICIFSQTKAKKKVFMIKGQSRILLYILCKNFRKTFWILNIVNKFDTVLIKITRFRDKTS